MAFDGPFPQQPENAVASYDWQDIASGLGYSDFFLLTTVDSVSSKYALVNQPLYSRVLQTEGSGTLTFNSSGFNAPRTVKGTAFLQLPMKAADTRTISFTATLHKVATDGTTLTAISSTITSDTYTGNAAGSDLSNVFNIQIPLTETLIGLGEKLRIVIVTTVSGGVCGIAHDPAGRTSAAYSVTTIAKLSMPFKIER